jgi:HD-GYP domain-containing protein (c-di-GMP phosphodiesterase class II)
LLYTVGGTYYRIYPREELLGKNDYDLFPKEQADFYTAKDREVFGNKRLVDIPEETIKTKVQGERVLHTKKIPIFDNEGKPQYLLGISEDITERKRAEVKTQEHYNILLVIRRINEYLLLAKNKQKLYQFVCDTLLGLGEVQAVWIGLKMPDLVIKPVASAGFDLDRFAQLKFRWDDSESGQRPVARTIREGTPQLIHNTETEARLDPWRKSLRQMGVLSIISVPIKEDSVAMGALTVWSAKPAAFDEETVQFLAEVAGDVALGVRSMQLLNRLTATLKGLQEALGGTVEAISSLVEYRDPYTAGHERRVALLACAIGAEMGLPEKTIEGLRVIGYLHDIGKIALPAELLSKPIKLSKIEHQLIQVHPQTALEILGNLQFPWPVAQVILQHHERVDGSGYPQGLKGEAILPEARIIAVADVVEAMSSHRPYRPGLGIEAALSEIERGRGTLYDPDVADACLRLFREGGYQIPA